MNRLFDRLTDDQKHRLGIARAAAIEVWKHPRHRYFTNHLPSEHSERIIEKMNRLLSDVPDKDFPTPKESFVLLTSAYLHDIGMQSEQDSWKTLDDVRDHHHEISRRMILGSVKDREHFVDLGLTSELVDEIALVSAAHRRLNLSDSEFDDRHKGDETLRLRFLGALLRLADSLDMDYRRVNMDLLKVADVPPDSRLHWWRCYYVSAITISNGTIAAQCEVPQEDYVSYIKISIERELTENLDKVERFIWPFLKLRVGPTSVRFPATKDQMSANDFIAFRRLVTAELHRSSLESGREMRKIQEQEERAANLLVEESRRICDQDPGQAADLFRQAAELCSNVGLHESAAWHMESAADLLEKSQQQDAAAIVFEESGDRWLRIGNPYRAQVQLKKSIELTNRPDDPLLQTRTAKLVKALALCGETHNALKLIQDRTNHGLTDF